MASIALDATPWTTPEMAPALAANPEPKSRAAAPPALSAPEEPKAPSSSLETVDVRLSKRGVRSTEPLTTSAICRYLRSSKRSPLIWASVASMWRAALGALGLSTGLGLCPLPPESS